MKYLCLVYHDAGRLAALPEPAYSAFLGEVQEYGEILRRGGYHVAASFLQPDDAATTVRVRNGTMTVRDGPAVPTCSGAAGTSHERRSKLTQSIQDGACGQTGQTGELGGFYLIDARDLNDAIRLVARMPPVRFGSIEIRPVRETGCQTRRFFTTPIDHE